MTGTPSEAGLGTWQVRECPRQIEYSLPILDEIRRIAVDAFFSLPRGGAEIGGILYGTQKDEIVRILAFRAMECEHAFGPTFVLSDKDKARLEAQLEELKHDLALRGLAVVGWYHTHTRSEIFLSEPDLEIYSRFFPEPWQVALVLRPAGMKPTRAGFFFRDGDGAIHNEASYHEFVVGASAGAHAEAAARPANGKTASAPAPVPVAAPEPSASAPPPEIVVLPATETGPPPAESTAAIVPATAKKEPELNGSAPPDAATLPSSTELVSTRRQLEVSAPAVETQRPDFVPPAFLIPPEKQRSRTWLWILLAVLAVGGAGAYFTSSYWMRFFAGKPTYLHLQAMDQAGQLRIQWDRESLAPLDLKGGTIEILDGPATTTIPLDPPKIRSGSFQYARRSEMVEVHMTVRTGTGSPLEEFTSFVGQPPPRQASQQDLEQQQQTAALATEAEKSRADLLKEQMRRLELEESLKKMQDALRREEERRRAEKQIPAPSAPQNTPKAAPAPAKTANNAPSNNSGASQAGTPPASASTAAPKPQPAAQAPPQPPAPAPAQVAKPAAAPEKTPEPASATRPNNSATPAVVNQPPAGPPLPSLSGRWVFSRASKTGSPFPPDSVTVAMTEAYGQVRGIFVGKYRVPKSRKFPATVKFNFEGAVHPSSSKFSFTADDGMSGEIELIRLPGKQDAIEVVWYSERDKLTFDDIFSAFRSLAIGLACVGALGAADYRASVATQVITPTRPIYLTGYASRNHASDGVLQDLKAKVLAIEDKSHGRVVIVTTDLIGLPRAITDLVAARVEEEQGLDRSRIIFNSSHTHTGPAIAFNLSLMLDVSMADQQEIDDYSRTLIADLPTLIAKALADLTPANLWFGNGQAHFAVNRREPTPKGIKLGVNPAGPTDPDVPVLKVNTPEGQTRALLFGYACHNTTLGGDIYKIGGDYAGFAQSAVEKANPGVTAMFIQLCAGDQNPNPRGKLEHVAQHGQALADEVTRVAGAAMTPVKGKLRAAFQVVDLGFNAYTREQLEALLSNKDPTHVRYAKAMLARLDGRTPIPHYPYPVQVVRFGNGLTILALGGEVVVDYCLRVKKDYGAKEILTAGYSNDVMSYIPTVRILREGGYEPVDSMYYYGMPGPYNEQVEEQIYGTIRKVMQRVGRKGVAPMR